MASFCKSYPTTPMPSRTFRYKNKLLTVKLCNTMHSIRGAAQAFDLSLMINELDLVRSTIKLDGESNVMQPEGTTTVWATQQHLNYYTENDVIHVEAEVHPSLWQRCTDPASAAGAWQQVLGTAVVWWAILVSMLLAVLLAPIMPFILPVVGWMYLTVLGTTLCIRRAIMFLTACSKLVVSPFFEAVPVCVSALKRSCRTRCKSQHSQTSLLAGSTSLRR